MCCTLRIGIAVYAIVIIGIKCCFLYVGYRLRWLHGDVFLAFAMVLYVVHLTMHVVLLVGIVMNEAFLLRLYRYYVIADVVFSLGVMCGKLVQNDPDKLHKMGHMVRRRHQQRRGSAVAHQRSFILLEMSPRTQGVLLVIAPDVITIISDVRVTHCLCFVSPDRRLARKALENRGFIQGDIRPRKYDGDRNVVYETDLLWPGGVIPYIIDDKLVRSRKKILAAMEEIHNKTCVRWVPRTNESDYVKIMRDSGCYSDIGKVGDVQDLSLGKGCLYHGTILHELGHAMGFRHEHVRPDRDEYINVYEENIDPEEWDQFAKASLSEVRLLTPFDYDSVMLYGSTAFAKDDHLFTMTKKDGGLLLEPYDKGELSQRDAAEINTLYGCWRRGSTKRRTKLRP